jgi:outer membrane murein-binding lipoprotein Lpp
MNKDFIITILVLAACVLLMAALCNCCSCADLERTQKIANVTTTQPVDARLSQDINAMKTQVDQINNSLNTQANVTAKLIETTKNISYGCDVWDNRISTGLMVILAIVCGWALYRTPPGKRNA